MAYKLNLAENLKAETLEVEDNLNDVSDSKKSEYWSTTWFQQFSVLLRRGLKERKHQTFDVLKIGQVFTIAFLSGMLWWKSDTSHIQDQVYIFHYQDIYLQ